jgi:molecular chaperone GrpE
MNNRENEPGAEAEENLSPEPVPKEKEPEIRQPAQVTISDVELRQLKDEAAEYKDKYLRLLAESENFRKRMQKERQEMVQYATQNLITDFLDPLDHLENALQHFQGIPKELQHWGTGFQMILAQFKEVLTNNGVLSFESKGKPFDPHIHEAIEAVETDSAPAGTVVEESLRGYRMGEKIIRPARVKVAKSK